MLFSSTWSERSRQIVPVVEQLCKKNPTVNFLKVTFSFCNVHAAIHSYFAGLSSSPSLYVYLKVVCPICVKVDVQTNAYLAKAESVEFVPTLKIYKNGYKVKELLGPSQETLEHAVSHFSH